VRRPARSVITTRTSLTRASLDRLETLLLRHVAHGRVLMAMPLIVVERTQRQLVTWISPGTPIAYPDGRADDGSLLPFDRWGVDLRSWIGPGRLELTPFGRYYSIRLMRSENGSLLGWYVNLQAMLAESKLGFDTTDWQLDLWIPEGGEAEWKDEDDLDRALVLGIMSEEEGRLAREEGHRVLEEWPFPTGWEDWRPDPAWPTPALPDGWDVV
jgi:Protein of unknown function (DUF402)